MLSPAHLSATEYQRLPQVAARAREFCGLTPGGSSRCVYLAAMECGHRHWGAVPPQAPQALAQILATGYDVARSLWDTGSLLVYVDLDYLNAGSPGEAFLHPADSFLKLEPTVSALWEVFDDFGMPMLDLVTGGGYGFVGRVPLRSAVAERLGSLVRESPAWHRTHERRRPSWAGARIGAEHAMAHEGLGLVLEHLVHRVLDRAAAASPVPLVVDNTEVGGPDRECASLDLTHMGDPLDVRHLRLAFGAYQKHRMRPDLVGEAAALRVPPLAVVPRRRRPLLDVLQGRGLPEAAEEAARATAEIPLVEDGLLRLAEDYARSFLGEWHRDYYAMRPHPPEQWPSTYDRLDPSALPPCAAACLDRPNDLLLKPAHLQLLVRALMARGWQPRPIAGLVLARYCRDALWGDHWERVDRATRADFDVRVFAGLIAAGRDQGIDFNCVSTQEKGMCPGGGCGLDLRQDRDRLLARVAP